MRISNLLSRARFWWHRVPSRSVLGAAVAVAAIAALAWQHYHHQQPVAGTPTPPPVSVSALEQTPGSSFEQLAPPTVSLDANSAADAKAVVTRFATNFGSPNGNRDDWLARITPDVSVQLVEQFRLTDIRNVTQASVAVVDGPVRQEPASMTFDVTYDDGSRIEVRAETGPGGWKAVNVLPLNSNGLPAPSADLTDPAAPAAPGTDGKTR